MGMEREVARRVATNVTSRIVTKLVWLVLVAAGAGLGLSQCGQTKSREQAAQQATAIINVNTASLDELMTLPRVNENLGRRIIAGRPYATVNDLEKVSGIGPKTLDGLRTRVTVGPAPAAPAR